MLRILTTLWNNASRATDGGGGGLLRNGDILGDNDPLLLFDNDLSLLLLNNLLNVLNLLIGLVGLDLISPLF